MKTPNPTSFLLAGSCKRLTALLSGLVGRVVIAVLLALGTASLPEAAAATVSYSSMNGNNWWSTVSATYASGGGFYGATDLGMWANLSPDKQAAAWMNFTTNGTIGGAARDLQVGDLFTITTWASSAYGNIGLSLNDSGTQGGSYANRTSGSRLYIQEEGTTGSWYVNSAAGNSTLNYNTSSTYHSYAFQISMTSDNTANVQLFVDGSAQGIVFNTVLNGTAGTNIDAFSMWLSDDWNGSGTNGVSWVSSSTSVQNMGYVNLGYNMTSGAFDPGLVKDGLAADSTSTASANSVNIGGNSGTAVLLNQENTYTGATTVNAAATARISSNNALGSTANGTTVSAGGAIEISGGITIGEPLTLNADGVSAGGALRNTSGDNFSTGAITLGPYTRINSDAGTLTLNGTFAGGSNVFYSGGSGNTTINGVVSGDGFYEDWFSKTSSIIKTHGGTLTLSGNNTYTGAATVFEGVLKATHANALGTTAGDTTVIAGAVLELSGNITTAEPLTLNSDGISYGGALRNTSGDNTSTGAITLASGSRINSDAGTLSLNGTIAGGANSLYIGGAGNIVINGVITGNLTTGNGALYKDGSGTLTLTGNNSSTLTGLMELKGGTISIGNINNLTSGTLQIGSGATSATLAVTDNISTGLTINVLDASTAGAINVADGKNFTLTGGLGGGATNTTKYGKIGNGTLTLGGVNTYGGQVQIGEGTVIGTSNSAFGTNTSTAARAIDLGLNVGDVPMGNNVAVYITDGVTNNSSIYVASNTSGATRTIGLSGSGNGTFQNEIYLDGDVTLTGGTGSVAFSGAIIKNTSNAGGGIIASGGTVTLAGNNTYTGGTTISAGVLQATHSNALGSTDSGTTVATGAALDVSGGITIAEALTLTGVGINEGGIDRGALRNTSGDNIMTGNIVLGPYTRINSDAGTLTLNGTIAGGANVLYLGCTGNITINGAISGSGGDQGTPTSLFKDSAGTLTLGGTNTYTGDTRIVGGTLTVAAGGTLGVGSDVFIGSNSTLAVNASTAAASINDWALDSVGTVSIGSGSTLTMDGAGSATFSGVIGGAGGLAKAGIGTQTLTGISPYTGNTTITGGTLAVTGSGNLTATSAVVVNDGSLLVGASNVINDVGVSMGNGTIVRGSGVSETFGMLTLSANSTLDFGTGVAGTLAFGTYTPTHLLTVGNFGAGNILTFGSDLRSYINGGTVTDPSKFAFSGGFTSNWTGSTFEIIAVPEPGTILAGVLLLGGLAFAERKRLRSRQ